MTSAIDATKPISGSPTTQSVRDNFLVAKNEISALQTAISGLVGMGKNSLINPNFSVNQRAVSGTVTLAAGAYGHDRWKAGASGCTYTFATASGITTLTITAGSLQQIIEAGNIPVGSNTCVLSWTGTSSGKISAGSYAASGVTATVVGGANTTVEFNVGTLSLVQFEKGSVATLFEQRMVSAELALCRYYYEQITATANQYIAVGTSVGSNAYLLMTYQAKRIAPTIAFSAGFLLFNGVSQLSATLVSVTGDLITARLVFSGLTTSSGLGVIFMADATAGRTITINAEL
jgi:hypothetical protein